MSIAPDEIPKQVGRYIIEKSVGYGAMGAVYRARDPLISRTVAIKTIRLDVPPASPQYKSFLQRFYTEAKVSGTLSHPNIVTLYDIGESEDRVPFLAMEYIDGETVAEMLESGEQLKPEQVVGLVSQMAAAVDYAHGKGVIHRDIKPSNIIVFDGEKVKITDFGIAKLMDAEGTQTASLLGTPSYMSPEQAMGENLDGRTDIFSLGVVAFEMLSGQQPFPGNNVTSILYKLVHADPVRPSNLEILGLLPDKWHQVFSKVLAKSPTERYEIASEFVADLERCLGAWFGSLESETAVISAPELTQAIRGAAHIESTPSTGQEEETEDETVLIKSNERPNVPTGLVANGVDATVAAQLPLQDENVETVLQMPAAGQAPIVPADQGGDTETVVLKGRSTGAVSSVDTTMMAPPEPAETGAETVLEAPSVSAALPTETTKRLSSKSGGKKYLAVAASIIVAALAVAAIAILMIGRRLEPIEMVPPVPPLVGAVPVAGTLSVVSQPEGASVWINGEERGVTPLDPFDMALGVHSVRVEKSGFRPEELAAQLREEQPDVRLDVTLERRAAARSRPTRAYIAVQIMPEGAQVLLDGEPVGTTPIVRLEARPGKRTLLVEKEGFESWESTFELQVGTTETITATLEPIPAEPPPEPEAPAVRPGDLVERGPYVNDPKCIDCPTVPYPEAAKEAKLQGVVEVSFIVNESGTVQDIRINESGGQMFDPAVVEVLKNWRYVPATKNGVPVKVRMVRRFRFQRGR